LGRVKDPKDILKLIDFTKSRNANERRLAASALGKMAKLKPEIYEAVPSLIILLKDKKPQVRQYALKALSEIGDERALKYLEDIAENDEKEYNRKSAKEAIKRLKK
jgi:HEAT repeat protein